MVMWIGRHSVLNLENNMENSSNSSIGFFGLLGIAFIVLKLTGYIDWSWWIVLSPIWGSMLVGIFFVILWVWLTKRR